MSEKTEIAWCDSTWNPWRGCQAVSPGCANCYAKKLVERWGADFSKRTLAADATFNVPLRWRKKPWVCDVGHATSGLGDAPLDGPHCDVCGGVVHRRRVFLGSLMDIFDPEAPIEAFAWALDIIRRCPGLDFLMVTKRPELWERQVEEAHDWLRGEEMGGEEEDFLKSENPPEYWRLAVLKETADWLWNWFVNKVPPRNVWIITTVENQEQADRRIPELLKIPAVVRGLSVEPMLGPVNLNLARTKFSTPLTQNLDGTKNCIDWVIFGGESGPGARPCNVEWIRDGVRQCKQAWVPCFVKQLGSDCIGYESAMLAYRNAEDVKGYKHPKGGDIAEWPEDLRVREWPTV